MREAVCLSWIIPGVGALGVCSDSLPGQAGGRVFLFKKTLFSEKQEFSMTDSQKLRCTQKGALEFVLLFLVLQPVFWGRDIGTYGAAVLSAGPPISRPVS